ncbi:hypothetical protein HK103_007349 [Boothiomyces macroporosus]|uniref:Nascent polypeptide-associated complex subunit alpha n=1 Tax=Boothiomyces macroporosus TaxID=261099 RepID=A0AAD5UKP9_9FUNG|nr:hypothetical protein HK103_007349 [Boothiomyces macroporosus]
MVEQHLEETEVDNNNISKNELKARKAMEKMGLKPAPEYTRVVIRRSNQALFVIAKPDVYKTAGGDTHVVFGEVKIEDVAAQQAAAAQFLGPIDQTAEEPVPELVEDEEAVDEEGVEANDIEMVMNQAGVSRAKAVNALKAHNNDIVNAIMELTM